MRIRLDGTDGGRDSSPYGSRSYCPAGRDDPWVQCRVILASIAYEGFDWPARGPAEKGRWVRVWEGDECLRECALLSPFVISDLRVRGYSRPGEGTPGF